MVDIRNPAVIAKYGFASVKFWHVVDGLYIWEFFITLNYELSVIQPYRWTIWIYSLTRVAALLAVIINLVDLNVQVPINCQVSVTLEMVPAYLALAGASLLLVLRITAVWERKRVIMAMAYAIWSLNTACLIYGISQLHSVFVPAQGTCVALNIQSTKATMIVAFATDILLLLIMVAGLLNRGYHEHGTFALGRLLWKQGVIWLLLATVAGITPTVFICLNLNDPLNVMFQIPWLITMSIAATRMYSTLTDFQSPVIVHEKPPSPVAV